MLLPAAAPRRGRSTAYRCAATGHRVTGSAAGSHATIQRIDEPARGG